MEINFHFIRQISSILKSKHVAYKILDLSKMKALADDKLNVNQKLIFALGKIENIVVRGSQHFSLFPQCFQNATFSRSLKVGIVW